MDDQVTTKVQQIIGWLEDKKADRIEAIDITEKSTIADCLIVCSGNGDLHNRAIADYTLEQAKADGYRCFGKEGMDAAVWVLLDFGDVIVHIFRDDRRDFYDLENLWKTLPKLTELDEA